MPNFSEDPDAFPSEPSQVITRAPAAPARRPRNATQQIVAQAEQIADEYQQQVAQVVEEQRAQVALMNEARVRFAKASLYQQILEGEVFEGATDHVTVEVNAEFREFALQKYCALLGIESETNKTEPKLTAEQIEVLAMMANSLLKRAGSVPATEPVTPTPNKVGRLAVRRQVPVPPPPPAPRPRPVMTIPAHGPIPVPQAAPVRQPPQQLALPLPEAGNVKELTRPDGTKFTTNQGIAQVRPPKTAGSPKPAPMPSPDEQVAIAAMQGERAAVGSNLVSRVLTTTSQG